MAALVGALEPAGFTGTEVALGLLGRWCLGQPGAVPTTSGRSSTV